MNAVSLVLIVLIGVLLILDVRYLYRNRGRGCSGVCSSCGQTSCKWTRDLQKARREIARQRQDSL